jgi:hypothetical protein
MGTQVHRQRGEIKQFQRAVPTASAEALLDRMLDTIDRLCAERDRPKKEQPGPIKGKGLGGHSREGPQCWGPFFLPGGWWSLAKRWFLKQNLMVPPDCEPTSALRASQSDFPTGG